MGRVILDTGVLIGLERQRLALDAVIADEDDLAVPAVVVAEFLRGVCLAATDAQRAERREFLDGLLATTPVEDYTRTVAEKHGELMAHVQRTGEPRGAHDLLIAATALATNRTLVTTDAKARFDELPGLSVTVV